MPTFTGIGVIIKPANKKKFYQQKEFIKQQKEWYKKLKDDGFEDLEWFNEKTGLGAGSPYLSSAISPNSGQLSRNHSSALTSHYNQCRNFLQYGPFYLNFIEKYLKSEENFSNFSNFGSFVAQQAQKGSCYNIAESILWELYCEGATLHTISDELRRLHKLNQLNRPPKRWGKAYTGQPYSIYWVQQKIMEIRTASALFNLIDSEDLEDCLDSEVAEVMKLNKGSI